MGPDIQVFVQLEKQERIQQEEGFSDMTDMNLQGENTGGIKNSKKEGFVKSPRQLEYDLFGPNSPLPEKWRVFNFIKYRIQDNKRSDRCERISREYIIENTGIWKNNFSRIIASLAKDKLIKVVKGKYRDSADTYWLCPDRFNYDVIVPDREQARHQNQPDVDNSKADVDNFEDHVDKSPSQNVDNINLMSANQVQHQIDVGEHQNEVETRISTMKSMANSASRSLSSRTPETNPRALGENTENLFSFSSKKGTSGQRYGLSEDDFRKSSREWADETNGGETEEFGEWLRKKRMNKESITSMREAT